MPVNEESAASIASGDVIGCGGNASTGLTGVFVAITSGMHAGNGGEIGGPLQRSSPGPPTGLIEHSLGGRQETIAIRPSVIVRGAILVLLRQVKRVWCILGRPRPALIGAVFAHEQSAIQRVIVRREAKGIAVAIAP